MPMQFHYVIPTTPGQTGSNTDLGTSIVRLGKMTGLVTEAQLGQAGTCTLELDDPTGTLDIGGLRQFYVQELSAPLGSQRVWTGYIGSRRYARGQTGTTDSLRAGTAARRVTVDLIDVNTFLAFRVFTHADANRPAETDVQRLAWILSYAYFSDTLFDLGYVNKLNPVKLDKADLRGRRLSDVLNDLSQKSGKNHFVYYNEATNQYGLWYDVTTSTNWSSTARLSNVLADIDNVTTFAVDMNATLTRDPSRVVAGVYLPYSKGAIYDTQISTSYTYGFRDAIAPNALVTTSTAADLLAKRYLADNSTEDDLLTCTVRIPAAHVNDIMAGQRVQVNVTEMPTYGGTYQWGRVLKRTVKQDVESDQFYNVDFEISMSFGACIGAAGIPAPTKTGSYAPLGLAGLNQWNGGGETPDQSWATGNVIGYSHTGGIGWPNPPFAQFAVTDGSVPGGTVDGCGNGEGGVAYIMVVGAGTLTVYTSPWAGQSNPAIGVTEYGGPTSAGWAPNTPGSLTNWYTHVVYPSTIGNPGQTFTVPISSTPYFTPINQATGSANLSAGAYQTPRFTISPGETVRLAGNYTHVTGNIPTISASIIGTVSGTSVAWIGGGNANGTNVAYAPADIIWTGDLEICYVQISETNGTGDAVMWNSGTISGVYVQNTNCYHAIGVTVNGANFGGIFWASSE